MYVYCLMARVVFVCVYLHSVIPSTKTGLCLCRPIFNEGITIYDEVQFASSLVVVCTTARLICIIFYF